MPKPRHDHQPSPPGPSSMRQAAVFLGAMAASAAATFGLLNWLGPARAIPSAMPIRIVQAVPMEAALVPAAPPVPRRVTVDSVAEGYKVDPASLRTLSIGWVDSVRAIEDGAVLAASGWAGDPELGLRVAFVGLGACGTIVATVALDGERPDVRDAVHPNLDRAGWSARVFAGHLPDCEDRRFEAYAILPHGRILAKLAIADANLPSLASDGIEAGGPADLRRPGDLPGPEFARARVARSHLPLRRCAGVECAETARLARGEHALVVVDRRDDWALVSVSGGDRAGWIAARDIERAPERLAQR